MDEELGVKVTVTRLRRRLSVESEDSTNSPSAPSTPKKRSTRLAAKPQLEHIEEDANENVPKNTRRQSVAREVADIAEEKVVTPARRSARIRSNTSLLADTTITAGTDSPRAKRAARRISQLGSDTETPASPARQTRRTRKNSINSVDNPAGVTENNPDNVVIYVVTQENAPIPEETNTDTNKKETDNNEGETLSTNVRKSPRLTIKKGTVSENSSPNTKKQVDSDKTPALDKPSNENPAGQDQEEPEKLSESSIDLLNQMAKDNTKVIVLLNKTTSAIDTAKGKKNKNKKNKSLTTLSDLTHEADNFDKHNKFGGGDKVDSDLNTSKEQNLNKTKDGGESGNKENIFSIKSQDSDAAKMLQKSPDANIQPIIMIEDSDSNCGSVDKLVMDLPSESGDQCVPVVEHSTVNDTPKRNTVEPMDIDESIPVNVTIHDDYENANSSKEEAQNSSKTAETDKNLSKQNSIILQFDTQKRKSALVDEVDSSKTNLSNRKSSINESVFEKDTSQTSIIVQNAVIEKDKTIETKADTSKVSSEKMDVCNSSKRQSLANESRNASTLDEEGKNTNKSKRKSSSSQESQNFENKSTLVISQLSTNETKSVANSPNITNNNLSKSLNVTELNNKNLDKKYSTSTPLQQKPLKKIRGLAGFGDSGKPINTSLMSPHIESKSVSKVSSKDIDSDSDNENDSSDGDNTSKSKSKMSIIDDEASEASDDYESGDSRDSAEREYEDENNIVEKGETLDSEEEYSNDSDYDKDSFVVSSDEEDDEMLSGTGDDLSISDNELKLTAKSKKKFDERKKKQQKNASKEMYDARHQNDSKKPTKPKSNRKRLESSSDSDEDDKPKKSNRLRIDSSQDMSNDGNEFLKKNKKVKPLSESICEDNVSQPNVDDSIVQKKKKVKRLSESVSEETKQNEETSFRKNKSKRLSQSLSQENANNEQEMTILNETSAGKKDPLSVSSIKLEPKTPQKDMNISTVPIVDNVEEIQLNANASIYQQNQTSDPLQETMDQDEDSSSSGNSEIMNNYNSVLENLNKQNKVKTLDHSLNIYKEKGQKKDPIIDQLNLTQTKKIKNKKNKDEALVVNTSVKKSSKAFEAQDDETSDSIDMRLLFPEDSNDSESNSSKVVTETFIPLRKSEAKTHIPEITNTSVGPNESLNTSKKKNKKRLSESITYDNDQIIETPFFIDSTGTHKDESQVELTSSSKKKKRNKNSISFVSDETESNIHDVATEPENVTEEQMNVSIKSDKKKKKKNRNLDVSQVEDSVSDTRTSEQLSTSFTADILLSNKDTSVAPNESLNTSKKKNKKRLSESVSQDDDKNIETLFFNDTTGTNKDDSQVELSNSSKKKKKKNKNSISFVSDETESTVQDVVADEPENVTEDQANVSIKSDKKKKKKNKNLDMSQVEDSVNISIASDEKISKQLSSSVSGEMSSNKENISEEQVNVSIKSDKKKKKKNKNLDMSQVEDSVNISIASGENISKQLSTSVSGELFSNKENITEEEVNVSIKSDKKKKKKNKNFDVSQVEDSDSKNVSSDKMSKQLSTNVTGAISNNKDEDSEDDAPVEMTYQSEKRVEGTDLYVSTVPEEEVAQTGSKKFKKNKKKKKKATTENAEDSNLYERKLEEESGPSTLLEGNPKMRKIFTYPEDLPQQGKAVKKRKERDDDNVSNKTKVSKQNSSDKIHVPRLPDSVLSQLNDQPTPGIRAIATSQFVVEPSKRKNKPSNYLEESVYLNDTPKKEKKSKHNKIPKVLPYLPTVTLSEEGYTSTFKINVLPNETEFVAHAANIVNFKNKLLKKNRNKKLGTLDRCKRQRMLKLAKF